MPALKTARVCIIGLGLMGGSLGMALRSGQACQQVIGMDVLEPARAQAVAVGAVDEIADTAEQAARQADVVVLATPVRAIIQLLARLGSHLPPCLVLDLGSTKAAIVQAMAGLPGHVQTVGGHPLCGKEKAGIVVADPALYKGATFCLTPLERTTAEALSLAQELVRAVGARPLLVDAERHDRLVAAISHVPYLMAAALTAAAGEVAAEDPLAWQLAASGFRDASRLAGSDVTMMVDILLTNGAHVTTATRSAMRRLAQLLAAVEKRDEKALRPVLAQIQRTRREVYP